ncbi:MAG: hypothetical protein OXI41_09820 [Chloroflexota bacterium]|nr:hypothetical protein [Chloroflexota bacterium]MDE2894143.1 hypothetical protein [Chloroflexota bacterium]
MKDQYAGNIGDFGKYGLLRALCKGGEVRLGAAWWMTPDDPHSSDGTLVDYLRSAHPSLRNCDFELFDALAEMVQRGRRSVSSVCELGILPQDTLHHTDFLVFPTGSQPDQRMSIRSRWLAGVAAALHDADLLFADPDNCLSESADILATDGPKYGAPHELNDLVAEDKSILIYHHFDRSVKAPDQLERAARTLQDALGRAFRPWTLRFRREVARGYLISPSERHREMLRYRLDVLLGGPWGTKQHGFATPHFEETGAADH